MATGKTMQERTGWRDEGISRHHRLWGVECQATDIDFLLLEYYNEYGIVRPAAIIEYKKDTSPRNDALIPYKAINHMCNCADLPFFVVRYSGDFKSYLVVAMNKWGELRLAARERKMAEEDYVTFLYLLRGYDTLPQKVFNTIHQTKAKE